MTPYLLCMLQTVFIQYIPSVFCAYIQLSNFYIVWGGVCHPCSFTHIAIWYHDLLVIGPSHQFCLNLHASNVSIICHNIFSVNYIQHISARTVYLYYMLLSQVLHKSIVKNTLILMYQGHLD